MPLTLENLQHVTNPPPPFHSPEWVGHAVLVLGSELVIAGAISPD